jgi:hypothetical protein
MANKIDAELIAMPGSQSQCTIWGEWAIVFTNDVGGRTGVPWTKLSQRQFTMENALAIAIIDGYVHANPALYCGQNDDNEAVFCIYKQAL